MDLGMLWVFIRRFHIGLGFVGLVAFWLAIMAPKGGRFHTVAGWVFEWCGYAVASSALFTCAKYLLTPSQFAFVSRPGESVEELGRIQLAQFFLTMLAFVAWLFLVQLRNGARVARTRRRSAEIYRNWEARFWLYSQLAGCVVLLGYGAYRLVTGGSGIHWLSVLVPSWAVVVIRDATERNNVERQLKTALHDAKAANRAKSEFLALVSHEMRTPLNSILGMLELALDTGLTPDQCEMLSTSRQSGQKLKRLIGDMLDYSQIRIGRFDLRVGVFDLQKLLVRLREEFSQRAQSNGLDFRWQVAQGVPQDLMGDERRLEQVIENILDNAIKFTEAGFISLSVTSEATSEDDVRIRFQISDSGVGVDPKNRKRIFQRFEQEDSSSTRSYGGIGLGLSICRQIVERMGGKISHAERPGGGSEFTFDVFMKVSTSSGPTTPIRSVEAFTDLKGRSVLLAEDDPPSRAVASRMLEKAGVRVLQAIDGLDAVEKFQAAICPIDAVFMDMMMPRLDGLEAAEQIRRLHPKIPIIAMTAQAMKGDRDRILAAGIDDYLPKPIERKLVLRALQNALARMEPMDQDASDSTKKDIATFDHAALFARCDKDEELYHEIVRLFLETCDETLARISRSLMSKDVEELIQATHRLNGAASNMCAPKALNLAAQLEAAARLGDLEKVHIAYAQMRLEVQYLCSRLTASIA